MSGGRHSIPGVAAPLGAGTRVGPYEIVGHLATGGMGEVYLARKSGLGGFERLVVLKIMLAHLARDERFSQMFIDEARIASTLSHPNIVQVFDLDSADGTLYLAMEHLAGQSVASCLALVAAQETHVPIEVSARVICDAATGLAHAHAARDASGALLGVVHRDVSPENLFVTYQGPTKILDFGVAKIRGKLAQTQEGEFKGKVAYMAPEIIRGRPADPRADLFALGVVMFELLTTRRLFNAPNPATTLHRVLSEPVPDLRLLRPGLDDALAQLCFQLLERNPDERVQTADEVAERLETWLASRQGSAKHVGHWMAASFSEAHAVSAKIQETVLHTGRVDPEDLRRAHRLGHGALDDGAIRELTAEERARYARRISRGEMRALSEVPGDKTMPGARLGDGDGDDDGEGEGDQDAGWITRASLGRWLFGLVLIGAFALGIWGLLEQGLYGERANLPAAGDLIAERYAIAGTVYESGRSSIFRARDTGAQDAPAMLWISERVPGEEDALLEAAKNAKERIQRARHPAIPDVHDLGKSGDRVFYALEWYEGRTLAEMLDRETIAPKRARKLVTDVAGAMAAAEKEGLVHGVLDPASILVDHDDAVMIVGFQMGFVPARTTIRGFRDRAPEVKAGAPGNSSADQYALGQLVQEVLRVWDQEGAVKAAAPIARATLPSPADRYAGIELFAHDLEQALGVKRGKARR